MYCHTHTTRANDGSSGSNGCTDTARAMRCRPVGTRPAAYRSERPDMSSSAPAQGEGAKSAGHAPVEARSVARSMAEGQDKRGAVTATAGVIR